MSKRVRDAVPWSGQEAVDQPLVLVVQPALDDAPAGHPVVQRSTDLDCVAVSFEAFDGQDRPSISVSSLEPVGGHEPAASPASFLLYGRAYY